jgi:hypothetical protein
MPPIEIANLYGIVKKTFRIIALPGSALLTPDHRRIPMKRPWAMFFAVLITAALIAGCTSATTVVKNARTSFEDVKAAGAETKAPYEYYAAEGYLGIAEHEIEEGDNDGARFFAEKSERMSAEARKKAEGGAK